MKLTFISSICFLMIFVINFNNSCTAQPQSIESDQKRSFIKADTKAVEIEKLLSTYAEYGEFNGAVLVSENGKIIFKKGFGFANMEWEITNQTTTKFRIGSVTKQFTAMLILQLVAENKLDLNVPISKYLPDYPEENGSKITIHHLLTHTSGVPNSYKSTKKKPTKPDNYRSEELINEFSSLALEFTPGEKFAYSNAGYNLMGHILESVSGKLYEDLLKEKILEPLEMNDTGFDKHRTLIKNRAYGYFKNWGDHYNSNYLDPSTVFAAGAMYSTVEDLFRWDQVLYTEKLLPKKYMDVIFTKHADDTDEGGHYGYGWSLKNKPLGNSKDVIETIGHNGVIDGFCTVFTRIPSTNSSIILLSNVRRAPLNAMTKGVMGVLYEKSYDFPRKSLAYTLLEMIDNQGVAKAIESYDSNKDDGSYYCSEQEINIVSYKLLQSERAEAAIEVLKLGIQAFPNAFNLYDSLGEVLRSLGRKEESIKNYQMSLKLNPMNENGIKVLNEMGFDLPIPTRDDLYFMQTDDTWRKEMFYFPLNFASDISYFGIEDARFAKGWENKDTSTFWTYVIGWNIEQTLELTKEELESDIAKYFDGLMGVVNKTDKDLSKVTSVSLKEADDKKDNYKGTINTYDSFFKNEMMNLNVSIEQDLCEKDERLFVVFRLSLQDFDHDVWKRLNGVKVQSDLCTSTNHK